MTIDRVSTLAALLVVVGACAAAPAPERPTAELESYLDEIGSSGGSGVALVQLGGEPLLRRGFGFADCNGTQPIGPDHLVMIGSITKEFTQILAYRLAQEGLIAFEDPIGDYLPELLEDKATIPLGSVVAHTSGLPDLIDQLGRPVGYSVEYDYRPVSRDELIRRAALAELLFEPGEREEYSNLGYNLLGAILEIAAEESYEGLLRSRIFAPAGMTHTGYTFDDWRELPFADGCRGSSRWGSPLRDAMWGADGPSWNLKAAGGLFSTVDDLARWFGALAAGKLFDEQWQKRYLDERLVPSERLGQRVMGPAGSNGIFNAVAYWVENDDLRIAVITTRSDYQAEAQGVARTLIRGSFPLIADQ